ncbi:MAG TPA: nucleotidyl transferase AbiEii/AbiGii toxin family protein [Draconibacterium sp.]|nr:nucleotidyl transferase AbiEii/AbiGii toxin family protein [Draconibacterium sp.]
MNTLAPHTTKLFDKVTSLDCIKPYILVGGTALALQLKTRLSEDLDFMSWVSSVKQKQEVDWVNIEKELGHIGSIDSREIWDFDHVEFVISGVKISFYASSKFSPVKKLLHVKNNLYMADIAAIAAMKMELLMRRSNFRDYYDIYSILKHGVDIKSVIQMATKYSGHLLSTKNLLAMLVDHKRFKADSNFSLLQPLYNVTPEEIEEFIKIQVKINFRTEK